MQSIRQRLRDAISSRLEPLNQCLALFEGGSAAFGRDDDLSDLDLQAIVEDGEISVVMNALEKAIGSVVPIADAFELPAPTWHGAWQKFYQLTGVPHVLVDFCIIERSKEWTLTEVERHGTPVILFDKGDYVKVTHVDLEKINADIATKASRLRPSVNMIHDFVDKEVARGRLTDAMHFYIRFVLYPLVDALRMKHDPARHDFSARYLSFDLPSDVASQVEPLFFIKDAADLLEKKARALEMFNDAIRTLDLSLPTT